MTIDAIHLSAKVPLLILSEYIEGYVCPLHAIEEDCSDEDYTF